MRKLVKNQLLIFATGEVQPSHSDGIVKAFRTGEVVCMINDIVDNADQWQIVVLYIG